MDEKNVTSDLVCIQPCEDQGKDSASLDRNFAGGSSEEDRSACRISFQFPIVLPMVSINGFQKLSWCFMN